MPRSVASGVRFNIRRKKVYYEMISVSSYKTILLDSIEFQLTIAGVAYKIRA